MCLVVVSVSTISIVAVLLCVFDVLVVVAVHRTLSCIGLSCVAFLRCCVFCPGVRVLLVSLCVLILIGVVVVVLC